MVIKDLTTKTCKWCYVVYFKNEEDKHTKCKKKRSFVLNKISTQDRMNKFFEYKK
jgi:hypothetical protein